ncbi:hypothetical protein HAX54_026429 [Datura stramonium]|uniref:Uncharacterized protein n=1 Tax=Datura stramonium TaxID=4076 RepID=A0ABS8V135_DATST|nr:hypothetical protein [Datura stramonium]
MGGVMRKINVWEDGKVMAKVNGVYRENGMLKWEVVEIIGFPPVFHRWFAVHHPFAHDFPRYSTCGLWQNSIPRVGNCIS